MTKAVWEIFAADVSEVEARVLVRYGRNSGGPIVLRGTLRGPYCELAQTLPADYPFHELAGDKAVAEAVVTDPCFWSEELPHLYHAHLEALSGDVVLAEYHGEIGLRRTSPVKNWDTVK